MILTEEKIRASYSPFFYYLGNKFTYLDCCVDTQEIRCFFGDPSIYNTSHYVFSIREIENNIYFSSTPKRHYVNI